MVIGLTGGYCTGKSYVSQLFHEFGCEVLSSDDEVRQLCQPGQPVYQKILEAFGQSIVHGDGQLNRKTLARVVFSDPSKLSLLEGLIHPVLRERMCQAIELKGRKSQPLVLEVPLLFEVSWQDLAEITVLVSANREQQIERGIKRDGLSVKDIEQRLEHQMPLKQKETLADFVIDNSVSKEQTRRNFRKLWAQINPTK